MRNLAVGILTDNEYLWLVEPLDQSEDFTNQLPSVLIEGDQDPVDELVDVAKSVGLKFIAAAEAGEIEEVEVDLKLRGWVLLVEPTEKDEIRVSNLRYHKEPIKDVMNGSIKTPDPYYELLQLVSQKLEEGPNGN